MWREIQYHFTFLLVFRVRGRRRGMGGSRIHYRKSIKTDYYFLKPDFIMGSGLERREEEEIVIESARAMRRRGGRVEGTEGEIKDQRVNTRSLMCARKADNIDGFACTTQLMPRLNLCVRLRKGVLCNITNGQDGNTIQYNISNWVKVLERKGLTKRSNPCIYTRDDCEIARAMYCSSIQRRKSVTGGDM